MNLTKVEREQLDVICDTLGHSEVRIVQGRRHKMAHFRIPGGGEGKCTIASSPSDRKGLLNIRTHVRRALAGLRY